MKTILFFTALLVLGLIASQTAPYFIEPLPKTLLHLREFATMTLLAFIMIEVGREFTVDRAEKKQFLIDYAVAATAATFPWLLCSGYFLFVLMTEPSLEGRPVWTEALLAGRFSAPTSAGVLFTMLAAAGLARTWTYRKTRILAIFDDLDTVLLMIPLKILMIGLAWQLGVVLLIVLALLVALWKFYRSLTLPTKWPYVLTYSLLITAAGELLHALTVEPESSVSSQIEVLLPAFVLGCMMKTSAGDHEAAGHLAPQAPSEQRANFIVSSLFLFLVGFSMPFAIGPKAEISFDMGPWQLAGHVLAVTVLSNLGKMFPAVVYRTEASLNVRLAVSVAMFPRGEVGAGILTISLAYGIQGSVIAVAFLSLVLNLLLTGVFIAIVKNLLSSDKTALNKTSRQAPPSLSSGAPHDFPGT